MKTNACFLVIYFAAELVLRVHSSGESCGKVEPVIYETTAKIGDLPWITAIGAAKNDNILTWCHTAGVLISRKHVLSAGSCVHIYGDYIVKLVRLGETNFNDTVDCEGEVCADAPIEIPVESAFSRYDEHWRWADNIGLIVLSIEVIYSKWIQPICLPNVSNLKKVRSYIGAQFITSGWIDKKQKTIQKFVVNGDDVCRNIKGYHNIDAYYHICANNSYIHAHYGPIMGVNTSDPDNPYWYIFGFFVFQRRQPRVGSKIVPFVDWILAKIKSAD